MPSLSGINDVSLQTGVEWLSGPAPTFVSTTSFTVAGDQTLIFTKGRRVRTTNTGGTVYSTITNVSFAGVTTVTVVNDSGVLDAGLSAVFYGLLDPSLTSIDAYHINRKGTAVASAATTDIWGIFGDYVHITGTNTIFSFSTAAYAGARRDLIMDGALTLATSAALSLPGDFNILTAAKDRLSVRADTVSTATLMGYLPASGIPLYSVQGSSTVFAGPASGNSTQPAFRPLVGGDGASMVLLDSQTVVVATSSVMLTNGWTSGYDEFEIRAFNVQPVSSNSNLNLKIANSSLAFVGGGAYNFSNFSKGNNGTIYNFDTAAGVANWFLCGSTNTVGSGGHGWSGTINFPNSQITGVQKVMYFAGVYDGSVIGATVNGAGNCASSSINSSTLAAAQFAFNSGNISTGTFRLYGIRKS